MLLSRILTNQTLVKTLTLAEELSKALPSSDDTWLQKATKTLNTANVIRTAIVGEQGPIQNYFGPLDVNKQHNKYFVDIFSDSPHNVYPKKVVRLSKETAVLKYETPYGTLYFVQESGFFQSYMLPYFWASSNFDFKGFLQELWARYSNRIHLEVKHIPYKEDEISLNALTLPQDPLLGSGPALLERLTLELVKHRINGRSRSYLFLGPAGVGKTTLALKLAGEGRTIRISAKGWTSMSFNNLSMLLTGLCPDIVLIDDLDYCEDLSSAMPAILATLTELKLTHPDTSLIVTANTLNGFGPALLRPERIDEIIEFELPNNEERREILKGYLATEKVRVSARDQARLVKATEGLTAVYLKDAVYRLSVETTSKTIESILHRKEILSRLEGDKEKSDTPKTSAPKTAKAS